jgi:hypothetical protein
MGTIILEKHFAVAETSRNSQVGQQRPKSAEIWIQKLSQINDVLLSSSLRVTVLPVGMISCDE